MKLIISHFNNDNNIFHYFALEFYNILKITKDNNEYIILLMNYEDTTANKWRFDLLNSIYDNVFIYRLPNKTIENSITETIILKQFDDWIINPWKFDKYNITPFYLEISKKIKKHLQIDSSIIIDNQILFIERKKNRILYDYDTNELLSKILKNKLENLNIPFKSVCFDDKTLSEQAIILSEAKIMISVHGAANTNLFLLPSDSYLFEINFRKHWYCDPVCNAHFSNNIKYNTNCCNNYNRKNSFHKADYHNLSQIFGINYKEFEIINANKFLDKNPINVKNIYVDSDNIVCSIQNVLYDNPKKTLINNNNIYVYIHVCCLNNWKEIFNNIIHKIKDSGLYEIVKEIRCGVLGDYDINIFNDPKIKIIGHSNNMSLYEPFTLNLLHEQSKNEDFKVLYLHTKGVTQIQNIYKYNNVVDWVNYMHYFNIYKNSICINLLNEHDCIGVNLYDSPVLHYSGNFWWSKSEYIKKLQKNINCNNYFSPELWISETRIGSYISLWYSNINHYEEKYPEENYKNKQIKFTIISPEISK